MLAESADATDNSMKREAPVVLAGGREHSGSLATR
jgi:hypothetical protein